MPITVGLGFKEAVFAALILEAPTYHKGGKDLFTLASIPCAKPQHFGNGGHLASYHEL